MSAPSPAPHRSFWRSLEHLWWGVATLGLGFASGQPLGLFLGAVVYALGLIYLPDSAWFRRRSERRLRLSHDAVEAAAAAEFSTRRTQLLADLSPQRRERYQQLVNVCTDISAASAESHADPGEVHLSVDTRLRKLDELLWTYLRLLAIGQSLETYLETERRENLAELTAAAEAEIAALEAELARDPEPPPSSAAATTRETRRKLLASRRDRLLALQQRLARVAQARANLDLARAEQERLVEQAKLIRADAVAQRNAESLGARIDVSIEHLAETNRWLAELAEFKDLTAQLPPLPAGTLVGTTPPTLPRPAAHRASATDRTP